MRLKSMITEKYETLQMAIQLNAIPVKEYIAIGAITVGLVLAAGVYTVVEATETTPVAVTEIAPELPVAVIEIEEKQVVASSAVKRIEEQTEIFIVGSEEAIAYEYERCERIAEEYQQKMDELQCIDEMGDAELRAECRQQWFCEYKEMIAKHEDFLEPADTIYAVFDTEELQLLFAVVQAEIGDEWNFEQKVNVASVIFNRMSSDRFPDTISELLCPSQFETVLNGAYENVVISEKTRLACEYAFSIGDTTGNCVYFCADEFRAHDGYSEYVMTDNAHNFYRLED